MSIDITPKETEYTKRLRELIFPHRDLLIRGKAHTGYIKLMPMVFPFIKDMLVEEGGAMLFRNIVSQLTPAFNSHINSVYTNLNNYMRDNGDSYGIYRKNIKKAILDIYGSDSIIKGISPAGGGLIVYESDEGLVNLIKKHIDVKEVKLVSLNID